VSRGAVFVRHLDAAFGHLRTFPEIGPLFHGRYRRLLVPRFPYGIFYTPESNRIVVAGAMHLRQNPEAILRRLGG
jgi:toxin ParE1/3/4